ncbi:MLO-like protein 1 [Prunus dulcis]|uniref:MLO-like protein 1 n=1 Tax=Prunus dulcis TaxID=3755 RepID=UPI00148283E5|nr:MLO-like protein 1 [Prunus dulcis]
MGGVYMCFKLFSKNFGISSHHKGKVPLLTATDWQHLQLFIFVLATVHATFSILTILFARARIREWKHWEDSVANEYYTEEGNLAFFKQFFGSVTKADYKMVRLGFIDVILLLDHLCRGSKFNFYNYMIRVLEADFKRVVGISWYLWFYVVISLLLNVWGWHAYFWISIIPLIASVGANLPTRIFAFIQFLCSYSTLPLYAIVTQMGAKMKPAIFEEKTSQALAKWVQKAEMRKALRVAASGSNQVDPNQASMIVQFAEVQNNESAREIAPELPLREEYEGFHFEVPFETSPSRSNP